LITRKVYAQVPPKVEYRLTPLGRSLLDPIGALQEWAEVHVNAVLAARGRADA
jgi:DNA-binding HxlR family transcriptional regulator